MSKFQTNITMFPNGVQGLYKNCVFTAPGLRIHGGSSSALAQSHTSFFCRCNGVLSAPTGADIDMAVLAGGNLAFDNGTVPVTTNSCRIYTFLASVSQTTGAVTYSTIYGADFPKHRPAYESDINLGDGTKAIIGFLSVKNEGAVVFAPNSTLLDAANVTTVFTDAYGYIPA